MSVYFRNRTGDLKIDHVQHYINFAVKNVDGKRVREPQEVVAPSLADEYSPIMNMMRNKPTKKLRSRVNVDVCDLPDTLDKIS